MLSGKYPAISWLMAEFFRTAFLYMCMCVCVCACAHACTCVYKNHKGQYIIHICINKKQTFVFFKNFKRYLSLLWFMLYLFVYQRMTSFFKLHIVYIDIEWPHRIKPTKQNKTKRQTLEFSVSLSGIDCNPCKN